MGSVEIPKWGHITIKKHILSTMGKSENYFWDLFFLSMFVTPMEKIIPERTLDNH